MNPFKVPSYVCQGHICIDEASRREVLYGAVSLSCCVQQLTNNARRGKKHKKSTLSNAISAQKQNSWWGVGANVVRSQPLRKLKCYAKKMLRCCIPFIAISSHVLLADQCKLADKKSKKKNFWGSTKCISGESCVPLTREPFSLLPILTTTPELHQMPFVNFFIKNKPVMLDSYRKKWCVAFQVDLFSLFAHVSLVLWVSLTSEAAVFTDLFSEWTVCSGTFWPPLHDVYGTEYFPLWLQELVAVMLSTHTSDLSTALSTFFLATFRTIYS